MAATYHYGNDIMPGKIFYRWPGAVHMTLFAMPSTDKTRYDTKKCITEVATVSVKSIVAAVGTVAKIAGGKMDVAGALDEVGSVA